MKDKTLLILAGGMGSRFGGLKQIEPFGPNGEFIIDYSVYDAINSGFNKIVFLIKKENFEIFKETIGSRINDFCEQKNVKIEYVFQTLDNVPSNYEIPSERIKPLGTAHAILCCKDVIHEPFMIINADDFYGRDAFIKGSEFIDENKSNNLGIVGYDVINTLTENGTVKRGVCNIKNGYLDSIIESEISVVKEKIKAVSLETGNITEIEQEKKVSMNMITFYPEIFKYLEEQFIYFLENNNLLKDEYLIPNVISKGIKENKFKVKVLDTNSKWVGVTYKEDKNMVKFYINSLIEDKEYPNNLWS